MSDVKQFNVSVMAIDGIKTHTVNCDNALSAQYIAEAIYPNMRVIDISEVKFTTN